MELRNYFNNENRDKVCLLAIFGNETNITLTSNFDMSFVMHYITLGTSEQSSVSAGTRATCA